MTNYQIAVIVGSLRRDSFNRQLATAIAKLAPADFSFKQVEIGDLPLYNQDDDANQAASVKRLKAGITSAQGLLFVTPEMTAATMSVAAAPCENYYCIVSRSIRLPMTSTSTRRSACRQATTAVLLAPRQSPDLVAGCDSPLPSVATRLASIPLLTR